MNPFSLSLTIPFVHALCMSREDGISRKEAAWVDRRIESYLKGPPKYLYLSVAPTNDCISQAALMDTTTPPTFLDIFSQIALGSGISNRLTNHVRIRKAKVRFCFLSPQAIARSPGVLAPGAQDVVIIGGVIREPSYLGALHLFPGAVWRLGGGASGWPRALRNLETRPEVEQARPFPYSHLERKTIAFPGYIPAAAFAQSHVSAGSQLVTTTAGGVPGAAQTTTPGVPGWSTFNGAASGAGNSYTPVEDASRACAPRFVEMAWDFGGRGLPVQFESGSEGDRNMLMICWPAVNDAPANGPTWGHEIQLWFDDEV